MEFALSTSFKTITSNKYFPRILIVFILIIAALAYLYFAYHDTYSNDSYVYANIVNITPQVSGAVSDIYIKDNQYVKAGEKLFQLDTKPYRYALEKAQALLESAQVNYQNNQNTVKSAEDNLHQAQVSLKLSQDHLRRYQKVEATGGVATVKIMDLESSVRTKQSQVASAEQQLQTAKENLNEAQIKAATAEVNQAQYNLQNTLITSPNDGYITNFQLTKGQYISADKPLFALVESDQWWVITRYRETVIRKIHVGDPVKIYIDMYPNKIFKGVVQSIAWGINREQSSSSAAPSTLAYLEATEDWIRIAQRFPVRIKILDVSKNYPLRVGASASTTVYEK